MKTVDISGDQHNVDRYAMPQKPGEPAFLCIQASPLRLSLMIRAPHGQADTFFFGCALANSDVQYDDVDMMRAPVYVC